MGATGAFYTFRRAVFQEPGRSTETAWPFACGLQRAHEALGLVDQLGARGAREALERAQRERRLPRSTSIDHVPATRPSTR